MAIVKYSYENEAEIPEKFKDLYVKGQDGKFVADMEGVKTFDEYKKKYQEADELHKVKKELEERIAKYGDYTPEDVMSFTEKIKELEAQTSQIKDPTEIQKKAQEIAEYNAKDFRKTIAALEAEKNALGKNIELLQQEKIHRHLEDKLRKISSGKINPDVFEDIVLNAKSDGIVYREIDNNFYHERSGMNVEEWFGKKLDEKKYWMPYSESGGANGGSGAGSKGPASMLDIVNNALKRK